MARKKHEVTQEKVEPAETGSQHVPASGPASPSYKPLNDLGNAERFAEQHGGLVRFCPETGKWLNYHEGRWKPDSCGMIHRRAHQTVRGIKMEAQQEGLSADDMAKIIKHAEKSASKGRISAMLEIAKWFHVITVGTKDLDADPWLLNCRNGTLNLKTGDLQPHNPGDLLTRMIEAPFDPNAPCPIWQAFLSKIMGNDQEKIEFLQRVFGYSLTGITREQCMFIFYGTGANGKTTFVEVMRDLLGDYATHTTTSSLLHSTTSGPRNDLARLNSSRLATAVEVMMGKHLDEALIKQLTGLDQVTARYLYKEFFEFRPQFKLLLAANHKPEIRGVDHGIWRRIHIIPFDVTIPSEEIDKDLSAKLKAELSGILAWAVRGCFEWRDRGLMVPRSIADATKGYRREMDVLENFIEDRCQKGSDLSSGVGVLYAEYQKWCSDVCQDAVGKKIFGNLMRQKGYNQAKSDNTRLWKGLELVSKETAAA
jgi:putative DNA primase/helicase